MCLTSFNYHDSLKMRTNASKETKFLCNTFDILAFSLIQANQLALFSFAFNIESIQYCVLSLNHSFNLPTNIEVLLIFRTPSGSYKICVEGSSLKEHTHQCESHKIQTRLSLTKARLGASISRKARKIGLPTER